MLKLETSTIQHNLADYCKGNKGSESISGLQNRLPHYKRLIFNIIEDALESAYPITKKTLKSTEWDEMILSFYSEHKCQHPQLFRMPGELIEFVENKKFTDSFEVPYLIDLLKFEWEEVVVHTMADVEIPNIKKPTNFISQRLLFSPYIRLLVTKYPIHLLKSKNISHLEGNYFTLLYRESNGTVQYNILNQFTFLLIKNLSDVKAPQSLAEFIERELLEHNDQTKSNISQQASSFLENLYRIGVILGEH